VHSAQNRSYPVRLLALIGAEDEQTHETTDHSPGGRSRNPCSTAHSASSLGPLARAGGLLPSCVASSARSILPLCRADRSVLRSPPTPLALVVRSTAGIQIVLDWPLAPVIASAGVPAGRDDSHNATKIAAREAASTPDARSPGRRLASSAPTRADAEALELFSDDFLQYMSIQRQVRHELLQLAILIPQLT
jgi:hypothetical protein